jgi:RNA polymerase sigma-70 factor (ECF subfamily)
MRTEAETGRAVELYADIVRRVCLLHLKNFSDVEDVFHKVFMKYVLSDKTFESDAFEKAWLICVTVNACRDLLKSFFRRRVTSLEDVAAESFYGDDDSNSFCGQNTGSGKQVLGFRNETRAGYVMDSVLNLPEKYKDVVYMHYYEGYTAVEIAKVMNKRESTVYLWLARAGDSLKKLLGGESLDSDIRIAFDNIKAEERLKAGTLVFLREQKRRQLKPEGSVALKRAVIILAFLVLVLIAVFLYNLYFTGTG